MTYHRGTLEEFNIWHNAVKISENITAEGKVGFVNGTPVPSNQRTTGYSSAIAHPFNQNDYIWAYGGYPDNGKSALLIDDAKSAGWFVEKL